MSLNKFGRRGISLNCRIVRRPGLSSDVPGSPPREGLDLRPIKRNIGTWRGRRRWTVLWSKNDFVFPKGAIWANDTLSPIESKEKSRSSS
jgi:hypothetical protein